MNENPYFQAMNPPKATAPVIYRTQEELDAALALWQKRLRVQDWDVKIKFTRARDFVNKGAEAEIHSCAEHKTATISILDSLDFPPNPEWPEDQENSLVHELVHLHLKPLDDEIHCHDPEFFERLFTQREQMVCMIADSLIRLARNQE